MATHNSTHGKGMDGSGPAAAIADKERHVSDMTVGNNGNERSYRPRDTGTTETGGAGGSFFDIYKAGQGYYTRIWSGVFFGAIVCWFAYFMYEKLELVGAGGSTTKYIQVGAATAILLGFGMLGYWLLALNRKVCDFMIATEGEMKKVNWTSRKEIIGSTKVVIFVTLFMTALLFVVDILFMLFFNAIGILKGGEGVFDAIKRIF